MTAYDVARAMVRRWWVLVMALGATAVFALSFAPSSPVYWARYNLNLVAPDSSGAVYSRTSAPSGVTPMAGILVAMLGGNHPEPQAATQSAPDLRSPRPHRGRGARPGQGLPVVSRLRRGPVGADRRAIDRRGERTSCIARQAGPRGPDGDPGPARRGPGYSHHLGGAERHRGRRGLPGQDESDSGCGDSRNSVVVGAHGHRGPVAVASEPVARPSWPTPSTERR